MEFVFKFRTKSLLKKFFLLNTKILRWYNKIYNVIKNVSYKKKFVIDNIYKLSNTKNLGINKF